MRNFKAVIQYEGTKHQGWQRQERTDMTIQGKLENVLSRLDGRDVEVIGSGRTDAGVHAEGQVANFYLNSEKSVDHIMQYCNRFLPEDIVVSSLEEVPERFHARYLAERKTYRYRVDTGMVPDVFSRRYVYHFSQSLDLDAMKKAAVILCGTHDFKAFTSNKKMKKSSVRTLEEIKIERHKNELWLTFIGDGFLYNMVRILVGTLLEVGIGARKPEEMTAILQSEKREMAGAMAPAQGLTLIGVEYPKVVR